MGRGLSDVREKPTPGCAGRSRSREQHALWGGRVGVFQPMAKRPVAGAQRKNRDRGKMAQGCVGLGMALNVVLSVMEARGLVEHLRCFRITLVSVWKTGGRGQGQEAGKEAVVSDPPGDRWQCLGNGSDQMSNLGCMLKVRSQDVTLHREVRYAPLEVYSFYLIHFTYLFGTFL